MFLLFWMACTSDFSPPVWDGDIVTHGVQDSTVPQDTGWDSETVPTAIQAGIVDEVVTVVRVRWETATESRGRVLFGESASMDRQTDLTGMGREHEVLLLGMPADTQVFFQVVTEDDNGPTWLSPVDTITTGSLPEYLPVLTAKGTAPSWNDFLVGPVHNRVDYALMIDNQGRIVWYDDLLTSGIRLMRVSLSWDRREMLYFIAGPRGELETGYVTRVSLDLSETSQVSTPGVHHDMIELPDGTFAAIVAMEPGDLDAAPENSLADAIVEFSPDGSTRAVWNAWDQMADQAQSNSNWALANALDHDPVADAYTVSMKEMASIVHIDRGSGETRWILGGELNQFESMEGFEPVLLQHQFDLTEEGIVIFDNGSSERGYSQVVELALDLEAMTVDPVWNYVRDPSLLTLTKGDVHRFDDGSTQVVWSGKGEIQDVTELGEVSWQLNTDGGDFVFIDHAELYRGE